ncbi:L-valine transporter subunit YgaH [Erwiniaceae bacterium CAU 1747]
MSSQILILGLVVGAVNFLFRYLPLRLHGRRKPASLKRGVTGMLLDSIGIASICALLIVSSLPDILRHHDRLIPTLLGFAVLCMTFYFSRSIVLSTLLSALGYGLTWKLLMMSAVL